MDCAKTTTYITCYLILDALLLHWINGQFVGGDMFHLSRTQYKLKDEQHMFYIISWWLISNYSQTKPPMIDVLTDSLFARRSLLTSFSYFIYGEIMISRQYIFFSICLLQWVDYVFKYLCNRCWRIVNMF